MKSTTVASEIDADTYSSLPLEQRVLVAAKSITDATPFSQVEALRQLAAVYQRAARHALSTDLAEHLQASASTARQLAHAIEQATEAEHTEQATQSQQATQP